MKKFTFLIAVFFMSTAIFAQSEKPTPSKYADVSWHTVSVIDFKPGEVADAKKIIERFESASLAAQTPGPVVYWLETGKYDLVVIWELKEGPSDLEWSWSPDGVKWWTAFIAQEGSEEAAKKLQDEYSALIASTVKNVARKSK